MTSDRPLLREEYWQMELAVSLSSKSLRFRSLEKRFLRDLSRSFRIDFSYNEFSWLLMLGSLVSDMLNSAYLGLNLMFSVKPNFNSSAWLSISLSGGVSKLRL